MGHIFISYSKKDTLYVGKLVTALRLEGFSPWLDVDDLGAGTHWQNRLHKQINTCDAYILIMSRHARNSQWVPEELVAAKAKGKPIFPLLLDKTELFLGIQTVQCEDVRGGKLPSEKFYQRLATVTARNKKASQEVDTLRLADMTRQEKINSHAEKITASLSKISSGVADFIAVSAQVTNNIASAVAKSPLTRKVNTQLKRTVKRTSR